MIYHWAVGILLLAFFAQAITSIPDKSPTFDEEFHIARAYAYVRTDDLRMQQNHPPLVSLLSGTPLLLMTAELTPPEEIPHWDDAFLFHFADNLFWRLGHDVDKMLFLARLPIIMLGTLLGAFVFRWAREAYGLKAGLLAAGLYAFTPNLLAHTRLVTTDLAVTACTFIALYAFWRYLRQPFGELRTRPSSWRFWQAGLGFGLALAAKLSALLLIPVTGLLVLLESGRRVNRRQRDGLMQFVVRRLLFVVRCLSPVVLVAGLIMWAFYRLEIRPWPGSTLPLPATTYLLNVRTLVGHAERGHGAFLMGQVSMHGWWYYFPITFLLKTPPLLLLLLGLAAWDTARRDRWREESPLLLYPMLYFAFTLTSSLNTGYRYILPITPFLIVYAAKIAYKLPPPWGKLREGIFTSPHSYVLALFALWVPYACVALGLHPHYLAYFNFLAGGPDGGYRYLVDSNLDWGQDLKLLKGYLDQNDLDEIWLGYFGTADPVYYDIQYRPLMLDGPPRPADGFSPINPAPGWYAISATVLQGAYSPEPDIFDWFRRHEPVAKVGYSIFIYRVEADPDPPGWLGLCYAPEPVMDDTKIVQRFGRAASPHDDLRLVGFDCEQAWVYPTGGGPGWYLVPAAGDGPGTLASQLLGDAEVVYRERGLRDVPGYTVYRWHEESKCELRSQWEKSISSHGCLFSAQAWSSPVLAPGENDPVTTLHVPADVGGQAVFLGHRLSSQPTAPGEEITLTTAWQVTARPEDPPLSVFAHLVGPAGAKSIGDGLGFPAIQWSPGDVFIQRNRLPVPPEIPSGRYWTQVGLYSLATGERLPVLEEGESAADRLLLSPVTIQRDE
jgi:hypothetical protein